MITNFLTVAEQVLVLFLLIFLGFICGKSKIINDKVSDGLSSLVMYFSTPAVIITSFFRPFDSAQLLKLLTAFAVAIVFHIIAIAVSYIFVKTKEIPSRTVARFAVVFSNAGYMSLPLQLAILGEDGVFFGSAYVVIFNIVAWTFGIALMGGKEEITPKKLFFNPGVISIVIGLILFVLNIAKFIPAPIQSAFTHIANLNTPVPMIIIGYYLSKSKIISAIADKRIWFPIILRLILAPALSFLLLYVLKFTPLAIENNIAVSCIVASSAPCAALTTVFSAKFNKDTALSVKLVSVSTLLSIITMPLFVALAQQIL